MEKLIQTDVKDERTLEVRVTAALYLCHVGQKKNEALRSLAEVISSAEGKSAGKGRAWANVFLLGSDAGDLVGMLQNAKLKEKDQQTLEIFQSRLK